MSSQCCVWGKGHACHVCKTNYNRMNERTKQNGQLRAWWRGLSKPEKATQLGNNSNRASGRADSGDLTGPFRIPPSRRGARRRIQSCWALRKHVAWSLRKHLRLTCLRHQTCVLYHSAPLSGM